MTYVIWGMMHGAYQIIGLLMTPLKTFILVNLAWILFRANSLSDAAYIFKTIFTIDNVFPLAFGALGLSRKMLAVVGIAVIILCIVDLINSKKPVAAYINKTVFLRYLIYVIILLAIFIFGYYGAGFDPQDFVYFQF